MRIKGLIERFADAPDHRRGRLPDRFPIHDRPQEVADRLVPGHWEGNSIKGAGKRTVVGILVPEGRTPSPALRAPLPPYTDRIMKSV